MNENRGMEQSGVVGEGESNLLNGPPVLGMPSSVIWKSTPRPEGLEVAMKTPRTSVVALLGSLAS